MSELDADHACPSADWATSVAGIAGNLTPTFCGRVSGKLDGALVGLATFVEWACAPARIFDRLRR